eukprot:4223597-Pleurochrysis_carterae.AAC.1
MAGMWVGGKNKPKKVIFGEWRVSGEWVALEKWWVGKYRLVRGVRSVSAARLRRVVLVHEHLGRHVAGGAARRLHHYLKGGARARRPSGWV